MESLEFGTMMKVFVTTVDRDTLGPSTSSKFLQIKEKLSLLDQKELFSCGKHLHVLLETKFSQNFLP